MGGWQWQLGQQLAQLEVANAGHTIANARWEAGNVRDVLRYYSAAPERLTGQQIPVPGGLDVTFKEPVVGPVLLGAGRYRGYGLCRPLHSNEAIP